MNKVSLIPIALSCDATKGQHSCTKCNDNGEYPMIEMVTISKGVPIRQETLRNKLILLIKGKLRYSYGAYAGVEVSSGTLFLLPKGCAMEVDFLEDTVYICYRFESLLEYSDRFHLSELLNIAVQVESGRPYTLDFNEQLSNYIKGVESYLQSDIRCYSFQELKLKELIYIFRLYYTKEELRLLLNPLLTNDLSFSDHVMQVAEKARTVQDLATTMGYSVSGFSKRFKKVFNEPAYQWLQQRKADRLYTLLSRGDMPLKALSEEEGFNSVSELNRFCKRFYGTTPAKIQKINQGREN